MTTRVVSTAIATAILAAVPSFAQTAAELLQKGIFAQEAEGKLDDAIQIYRQIVNSAPNPREIGAQAQYRLAQALLQKGDTNGAAQEFARLARDYSEYSGAISQLARQGGRGGFGVYNPNGVAQQPGGPGSGDPNAQTVFEWDPSKPISLIGKISKAEWLNPVVWLTVDTAAATYRVRLASPQYIVRAGMTRNSLTPGMEVFITGILAKDGSMTAQAGALTLPGKLILTFPAPAQ
jgi:tetratricopeptide (TPR) repeat protein